MDIEINRMKLLDIQKTVQTFINFQIIELIQMDLANKPAHKYYVKWTLSLQWMTFSGFVWFICLGAFQMRTFENCPFCHISFTHLAMYVSKIMFYRTTFSAHFESIFINILKCTLKCLFGLSI